MTMRKPPAPLALAAVVCLALTGCTSFPGPGEPPGVDNSGVGATTGSGPTGASATERNDESLVVAAPQLDGATDTDPLVEYVAERLNRLTGHDITVTHLPTNTAVLSGLRAGEIDLSLLSGIPAALAVATGDIDPLVAWPGPAEPAAQCAVVGDHPLRSLSDLTAEDTVAFNDPEGTSGYYLSGHLLYEAGLTPHVDYQPHILASEGAPAEQAPVVVCSSQCPAPDQVGSRSGDVSATVGSPTSPTPAAAAAAAALPELRPVASADPLPVSLTALGSPALSPERRDLLLDALPQLLPVDERTHLGQCFDSIPSHPEPALMPDPALYQPLLDVAATHGLRISDFR